MLHQKIVKIELDGKVYRVELEKPLDECDDFDDVLGVMGMKYSDVEEVSYIDDENETCYFVNKSTWNDAKSHVAQAKGRAWTYLRLSIKSKKKKADETPGRASRESSRRVRFARGSRRTENCGKKACSEEELDQVWARLIQLIKTYALFLPPEVASIVNSDKLDELKESEEAKKFIRRFANVREITPITLMASFQSEDFKAFMTKVKSLFADVCKEGMGEENDTRDCAVVHVGVSCDGCQQNPIRGPRFKCQDCANFDFCSDCRFKAEHDSKHSFDTIEAPRFPFGIHRRQQRCPWPSAEAKSTPTQSEAASSKPKPQETEKADVKSETTTDSKQPAQTQQSKPQSGPVSKKDGEEESSSQNEEDFEVVPTSSEAEAFEKQLGLLAEMGFTDKAKNLELLRAMNGDLKNVLPALFEPQN